ncbi:ABC transporter substrate-binding protein [Pollutimonas nitritireducens]|uniref:ABC transporter substrate-binding protein n=1 Tax=Pollutimonas nitritireducens TaxID=2045209 RepID=A0A2N4UBL3_9BURK|nr:tripartite tricarboxylate transporter substrate binding protein [Pollutimonas nitritireducens]PLC52402.1 ABC transporter substrate-binding protein [Pollutimonas nitritireducens]
MNNSTGIRFNRQLLKSACLALGLTFTPLASTAADSYPSGPVSMMVPYPAGGPSDVSARILSGPISAALGQQVVVENMGGATGTIAATKVLNGKPDGSVFFQGTQNELILPPLTNKAIRYEPEEFESLQPITVTPLVLLVRAGLSVNTPDEFLKLAAQKTTADSLTYGTVGVGSLYHLITERMATVAKVPLTHAPYKGTAAVVQDLSGGQIDFSIMPFQASMKEMAKSGRIKIIAVMSKDKPKILADFPSITETDALKDFDYASYAGYFVKKGTPKEISRTLNKAIGVALKDPEVIAKLEADGRTVAKPMTLEEAQAAYAVEIGKYKDIIKTTGFQPTN